MTATEEPWVTLKDIADHLSIHPQTAWAKAKRGDIPGHRIDGKGPWKFKKSEVDAAMRESSESFAQSAQSLGRKRVA